MKRVGRLLALCLLAFFVGMILHLLHALSPIHELGHIITGGGGKIIAWDEAKIRVVTPFSITGGHYFCLVFYTAIAVLMFKKHPYIASFAWGAVHNNMTQAMGSEDFNTMLPKYLSPAQLEGAMILWVAINVVVLILGWIVVILQFSRRAELIVSNSRHQCPTPVLASSQKDILAVRR